MTTSPVTSGVMVAKRAVGEVVDATCDRTRVLSHFGNRRHRQKAADVGNRHTISGEGVTSAGEVVQVAKAPTTGPWGVELWTNGGWVVSLVSWLDPLYG